MHFRRESSIDMYILAGFISFAAIVFVFVAYFSAKALNKFYLHQRLLREHIEVIYSKDYYDKLAGGCLKKENKECCLSSVEAMRIGNYGLLTREECPKDFVNNTMNCIDSYVWCQLLVDGDFSLDLFVGGSIFSNNVNIKVTDGYITYKQTSFAGDKEIESLNRPISESEMDSLRSVVGSADLMSLTSQNFKNIPLMPGQAYYEVSLSVDKKKNKIKCGMPFVIASSDLECQKGIGKLLTKFGEMLNINIK